MELSKDLISQFVKATKDDTTNKKETTVYGTIVKYNGKDYVQIDGSELLTPATTTTDVADGERVTGMIKNHTLIVTGNMSSPAARTDTVKELGSQINEFDTVLAYKVSSEDLEAVNATIESLRANTAKITNLGVNELDALYAEIDKLESKFANIDRVNANDITALNAEIENLEAEFGKFSDISTEDLDAITADINSLRGYTADFTYVSADVLHALKASIDELDADKISAEEASIKYANIDFSNIGEAAVKKIFADSGIIKDLIVDEGKITGELVGVTIKGDLIEGNTIKADKLVVKGRDGIYYKLNIEGGTFKEGEAVPTDGLHGSVITAKSITAEKVAVTDLVAFGATIGGFKIGQNSIYSGVKEDVNNTTRGIYLDNTGQIAFGDSINFIKFYEDTDGTYKLDISASEIRFAASGKSVEETITEVDNALPVKSDTEPTITTKLWLDTSVEPNVLKHYNGTQWVITNDQSGEIQDAVDETKTTITTEYTTALKQAKDQLTIAVTELQKVTSSNTDNITSMQTSLDITSELAQFTKTKLEQVQTTLDGKVGVTEIREWARFDGAKLELGTSDSVFKAILTNTELGFYQGEIKVAWVSNNEFHSNIIRAEKEISIHELSIQFVVGIGYVCK